MQRTNWKIYIIILGLVFLLVAGGGYLLVRRFLAPDTSGGIDPTLVMVLTLHVHQNEIATQVAEALGTQPAVQNTAIADGANPVETEVPPAASGGGGTVPEITPRPVMDGYLAYTIQTGDTLEALEKRFDVNVDEILSVEPLPENTFLEPGRSIYIPFDGNLHAYAPDQILLPDMAVVDGLLDAGFDIEAYIEEAGGYLSHYSENSRGELKTGAMIVQEISDMHSISSKLLLAVLEYQSGWVLSDDAGMAGEKFPIGYNISTAQGLFEELYIVARELGKGYYGWREGSWPEVYGDDAVPVVLHPAINAGTAALSQLMAGLYTHQNWSTVLYGQDSLSALYLQMYGDPFEALAVMQPHIPYGLTQPEMVLPFQSGEDYNLTSGPHRAWGYGSPWAAIDFAPADGLQGCAVSPFWVTSATGGLVVRSENGGVFVDVDMDGDESTGWVIFYLHIANNGRVAKGTVLNPDDRIGHASCEGGVASGSHVHIARKYNGEWITAGGPIPMNLSGWVVINGKAEYSGTLQRNGKVIFAYPYSIKESRISRD